MSPRAAGEDATLLRAVESLAQRVEELGNEIRALGATRQAGVRNEMPARAAVGAGDVDMASLESTLARLADSLEGLSVSTPRSGLRPPRAASEELSIAAGDNEAREGLRRELLLEGYQSILDRYGKPDFITTHDSQIVWHYASGENRSIGVVFDDGLVTSVRIFF